MATLQKFALLMVALVAGIYIFFRCSAIYERFMSPENKCLLRMNPMIQEFFQPPVDCNFCKRIKKIRRERNLKPQNFENWYAYNSMPVIVTDAQTDWSAGKLFSLDYFINLYEELSSNVEQKSHCQFFPYLSDFSNLEDAFHHLNPNRSNEYYPAKGRGSSDRPWYFGWSNCDPTVADELRKHYSRPYFLPTNSYVSIVDWIFMGQPGHGANMHVDHVKHPSWQAQVKGRKRWILLPPMECYKVCHKLDFVVEPGEIIILDTNVWFHQTRIVGDEISIVIGSEYD